MKITFIGHGYVGLVTAAVFADFGNKVYVIGHTKEKIDNLKKGISPFYEPGLEELVKKNLKAKRLIFTLDYKPAIPQADVVFIAVGTPTTKMGDADLSTVLDVAEKIGKNLEGYTVVATKSTVPAGTNKKVQRILEETKHQGAELDYASVPEFLREGSAISDTINPDRVVIGTESKRAQEVLMKLHKSINAPLVLTNFETAELIKYASNSLLSTKISFANAMAFLCDKTGADVEQVLTGVGLDNRIGRSFLYPGVGYGGSCFPKDVKALIAIASEHNYDFALLKAVDSVNTYMMRHFVDKISKHFKGNCKGKTIAVLGLAFKPNTDDTREAPAFFIIEKLLQAGFELTAYDPEASEHAKLKFGEQIKLVDDPYQVVESQDSLAIMTEWNEFKQIDLQKVKELLNQPVIFDGRNLYELEQMQELGFIYYSVGRQTVS